MRPLHAEISVRGRAVKRWGASVARALDPLARSLLRVRPHELELLRPRRPVAPLAWLLLALGMASLGAAALDLAPAWRRAGELEREQAELAARLDRLAAAQAAQSRLARRSAGKDDGVAEAQALVDELARPWHALFDQLESADSDGVHLEQVGVESRFATLQLVAESRDLGKLVQFSQRLSDGAVRDGAAGPIHGVTMTHHEWRDALGAHVVSAAMQGRLPGSAGSTARGEP